MAPPQARTHLPSQSVRFSLKKISETNGGFNATNYQPVKILDVQTQLVVGFNTKILAVIGNGKNASDSKKLLHLFVHTG